MAEKTFVADIDEIIRVNQKRMDALIRQSTQDLVDIAQTPVGKGGKMRVDTGFLRASGSLSLNGMPSGPTRPDKDKTYTYDSGSVELKLAKATVGDTIFFAWSANYAAIREVYDGFLASAVQQWPSIVERVTNQIRERITK